MKRPAFALTAFALQAPAFGHHAPLHLDVICTDGGSFAWLAPLTFAVLAAIGIVRAVVRHLKDR